MTKLPGCKAIFNPEDFRTIQEKLSSRLYFQFKFLLKEISGSFLRCYGAMYFVTCLKKHFVGVLWASGYKNLYII